MIVCRLGRGRSERCHLSHDWAQLRSNIQAHIRDLNGGYIKGLRSAKVNRGTNLSFFLSRTCVWCAGAFVVVCRLAV